MYTILIDDCKDKAGHEELSTCFRYVNDDEEVQERFYQLTRMKETDAQTITREGVLPISKEFDSTAVLLSLGADGASVMSGCNEGVAAQLEKTYPWLIYIHCAAHRLNLIVVAYFCKVNAASAVIKAYKSLHTIFNVASHREVFESVQREIYPKEQVMAASSLTEVRWACKFEGVNTMVRRYQAILVSLQKIDYEDPINDIRESEEDSRDLCESLKSSTVPFLLQELERRFSNSNVEILSAMDALDA